MNVDKTLRQLYDEKKRLDRIISRLESRLANISQTTERSTRGRKSMSPEERLLVSARMTRYWAARRAKSASAGAGDPAGPPEGISA